MRAAGAVRPKRTGPKLAAEPIADYHDTPDYVARNRFLLRDVENPKIASKRLPEKKRVAGPLERF